MKQIKLEGILQKDGTALTEEGKIYNLPKRSEDREGFPMVLIEAKSVGGEGSFYRQSIKNYIGMKVKFSFNIGGTEGFGYEIIKEKNQK
ncbi:MAG: hypothetical protein ACOCUT_00435 [bacterium]